jgi:hypothetical protein
MCPENLSLARYFSYKNGTKDYHQGICGDVTENGAKANADHQRRLCRKHPDQFV